MKIAILAFLFSSLSFSYDRILGDPLCGQLGQKACTTQSKEFWKQGMRPCDRGLKKKKKSCVNHKRSTLKLPWIAEAHRFQRELLSTKTYVHTPLLYAHNSYNNRQDRYKIPNQYYSITDLLNLGVRILEWDVHNIGRFLRLCHGTDKHIGCSLNDRPFYSIVEEFSQWIRKEENQNEIVVLHIQEEFQGKNEERAKQDFVKIMRSYLGDLIASRNQEFFSADELREVGKRIIIWSSLTEKISRNNCSYITVEKNAFYTKGEPKKASHRRPSKVWIKTVLGNSWALKTEEEVKAYFISNEMAPLKFDYITPKLVKAAIWSWEPQYDFKNKKGNCVVTNSSGHWVSNNCFQKKSFACKQGERWMVTSHKSIFSEGKKYCHEEFPGSTFELPRNGYENDLVRRKGTEVYLNLIL